MLFDVNTANPVQYASSGLMTDDLKPRPAADFILQTKKLLGNYSYRKTINKSPVVDVYQFGNKTMFVLVKPTQDGSTTPYTIKLPGIKKAKIHQLVVHGGTPAASTVDVKKGKIVIQAAETPTFVETLLN